MIGGATRLVAHVGYPTTTFRSPSIYNPWFAHRGIDAVVVPMAVDLDAWPGLIRPLFAVRNVIGALVTMPLKVATLGLVDEVSVAARVAGACNAVRAEGGRLIGDMFDGAGFVRGLRRRGHEVRGARALVVGSGGVGSAIAASLAEAGVAGLGLFDVRAEMAEALAGRLRRHFPGVAVTTGACDPGAHDIVVNATPLGMAEGDALPFDVARLRAGCVVGEVVLRAEDTPMLRAARARGCAVLVGDDMLFEQIPAYLAFFGLGEATAEALREVAGRKDSSFCEEKEAKRLFPPAS